MTLHDVATREHLHRFDEEHTMRVFISEEPHDEREFDMSHVYDIVIQGPKGSNAIAYVYAYEATNVAIVAYTFATHNEEHEYKLDEAYERIIERLLKE